MKIDSTRKEDLTTSSLAFFKKYAKSINIDEDIIISGFLRHNESENLVFEKGEVVHLDIGRCTYSCSRELQKRFKEDKGEEYYNLDEKELEIKLPPIEQVDLSDLKNLRFLEYRYHDYHYKDSEVKIDFISFNAFKDLEVLHLTGNLIGEIDISECKKLKTLICSGSSLNNLDCTHNSNLEHLDCSKNKITTLDLTQNKKLKRLSSFSTPLKEIIFCKEYLDTPQLNPLEILEIGMVFPQFKINLQSLPNLKSLTYYEPTHSTIDFSNNKELKKIRISFNANIESIDISSCLKLNDFDVHNMKNFNSEIICNVQQSFLMPFLSKVNSTKPNPEQKEYLKTFRLHQKALDHESDSGFYELKKILKDKYCDIATALMLYWTGNPQYFLRFKSLDELKNSPNAEDFEDLLFIENRILKGTYKINLISFDPTNFNGHDMTEYSYDEVKAVREIPEQLKMAVPGQKNNIFNETEKIKLTIKG